MPTKYRSMVGTFAQFADSWTPVMTSLYHQYVSKDWLPFQIFSAVLTWVALIALLVVPESPKYLFSKGRYSDSRKALGVVLRFNNCFSRVDQSAVENIRYEIEIEQEKFKKKNLMMENIVERDNQGSLRELFKESENVKNLVIFAMQWVTGIFAYYNIYFQLKYFKGDIFTNVIIAGSAEMGANLITGIILTKMGVKSTYLLSYFVGVSCSLIMTIIGPEHDHLLPFLLLGSFYGYCSVVLVNWIATPSLFPVIYTSSIQGTCNLLARMATILAPQVAELA